MSLKMLSCLFVLTLVAIACEGNSRTFLRNPNYRDLYYRNQFYGGLADPNPAPIRIPSADRILRKVEEFNDDTDDENDDTDDLILGDEKGQMEANSTISGRDDRNFFRPFLLSLRSTLRQLVRSENESKVVLKKILSVHEETLTWQMGQATSFYSLISSLLPSY